MAFQPIVNVVTGSIYAYEALARNVDGTSVFACFASVPRERTFLLDEACRARAIQLGAECGLVETKALLAVNLSPGCTELSVDFFDANVEAASCVGLSPTRMIVEITEGTRLSTQQLRAISAAQVRHGFLVAIDDFGAGFNGYELLSRFEPEIVKIDMQLTRGIDRDTEKRHVVEEILNVCRKRRILVIAEGIERIEELDCVREMGVSLCQGFLLGRPMFEGIAPGSFVAVGEWFADGAGMLLASKQPLIAQRLVAGVQ